VNQEKEDESPSCKCYVQDRSIPCPVHGHDRSETLDRNKNQTQRVVNTTTSLRKPG